MKISRFTGRSLARTLGRATLRGLAIFALAMSFILALPSLSQAALSPGHYILLQAPATSGGSPPAPPRRTSLMNPLGTSDIKSLVGRATGGLLGLSGSFALLMFVYGGFMWVTSGGSVEKVTKGKKIFTYAVIGLVVIFGSYAFLNYFLNALGGN